ncbi:MAG: lipid-A-disaccharide synthase [Candidatus Omnitrophica bacterium]|nr:lipid-A-disaccharide synthase [Candidatus Omnitrophota bacterium]
MAEKNILIVAGEASGELYASHLVRAIKEKEPKTRFFGLGGEKMRSEGVKLYRDIVEMAVMGYLEVARSLPKFKKIFDGLLKEIDQAHCDLAILVDYPDFNLRLAKELKKRNIPVIYYISPQVWAWKKKRLRTIKEVVSRMIVIFPFEREIYRKEGIPVSFAGNPLLDIVVPALNKKELSDKFNIPASRYTIALLPGSRASEVKNLLPVMLDTAKILKERLGDVQFLILRCAAVKEGVFKKITRGRHLPAHILTGVTYEGVAAADFAIVASGTATLESAILGTPMVLIYKVAFVTWAVVRMLVKLPYVGIVNILFKKKIIPEFLQFDAKAEKIASEVLRILTDPGELKKMKASLLKVKPLLGEKGASERAARIILGFEENA